MHPKRFSTLGNQKTMLGNEKLVASQDDTHPTDSLRASIKINDLWADLPDLTWMDSADTLLISTSSSGDGIYNCSTATIPTSNLSSDSWEEPPCNRWGDKSVGSSCPVKPCRSKSPPSRRKSDLEAQPTPLCPCKSMGASVSQTCRGPLRPPKRVYSLTA